MQSEGAFNERETAAAVMQLEGAFKEKEGAKMKNDNLREGVSKSMSVSDIKCDQLQVSQDRDGNCSVSAHILPPQLVWCLKGIIIRDKSCLRLLINV